MAIAEHFVNADHPGQPSGDGHRQNDLLANRNAAVLRSRWVRASRTQFITPLRLPQKYVHQDTRDHREDESDI